MPLKNKGMPCSTGQKWFSRLADLPIYTRDYPTPAITSSVSRT